MPTDRYHSSVADAKYADICSACGDKWEADEDDQGVYCACCGAYLETEAERERNEQTQDADY